ncbi:hypothetical protein CK203_097550 [Vitis vinifera]|uniref:DUF4283 domain-containing protein n=1 Tax=Vitis vinifera TaxID=29760 RepID=A0A438E767_VITVI|nr:hypothetical protein CK203_097550 [Vitis vinifera]
MGERERERERVHGSRRDREGGKWRDHDGEGDDDKEGNRRRRRGFAVESKMFELELLERRGKSQIVIEESKGGVSSWVRMGLASLGVLMEGLNHCLREEKEDRWVKEWKEQGRSFSLVRSVNKAGCFLRLGVTDLERKQHRIFIPKGRGGKMGWSAMMENLQVLRMSIGRKNQMQGEKVGENMDLKRSFAEVVKKTMCRAISPVQVKLERKEIQNNLERLKHCVVGRWNPSFGDEEDLEKVGRFLASSWGLKGSLGLAKLEDSKVLLEFELLEEAKRASLSGEKRMGAIRLGFEEWRPWDGCREEKEDSEEIWVRIFGLPVLLWNPTVLRRVGEECGGFIDIDSKTKKLEELQWARILVRSAGGDKPSTLEIGIEEEVFTLALWWESRPTVRKIRVDSRRWGEVRDDSKARADSRVEMEPVGERNEALVPSEEGTGRQVRKMGWEGTEDWAHQSGPMGFRVFGPDLSGLKLKGVMEEGEGLQAGPSNTWAVEGVGCVVNEGTLPKARVERSMGLLNPEQRMGWQEDNLGWLSNGDQAQETRARTIVKGSGGPNVERGPILIERRPSSIGSDFNQAKRWAQVGSGPEAVLEEVSLNQTIARNKGNESLENRRLLDCIWESEEARSSWEKGIPSATDKALAEEAMRYDSGLSLERERGCGSSHLILYSFDRTPVGESFDHSGVLEESNDVGPRMDDKGCWDMVEFNKDPNLVRGVEWNTERTESQEVRREKENRWEESSLAKFSHFLGFSTEGLEKEILNFLVKIRKRREKIHSKELMEKSKFERELKRLECSVNYEKGGKQRSLLQGKGDQLVVD